MKGVSNFNDLKIWFFSHPEDFCYWTIYGGHLRKKVGSLVITRNETESDKEDSWEKLQTAISIQSGGGGKFTILVSNSPKGNAGYTTFLTLADPTGAAAINGISQSSGIYGANVDRLIERERARTEYEVILERDLEDAQSELKAKNAAKSTIGRIFDTAMEDPQKFAQAIAGIAQGVAIGLAAFRNSGPTPYVAGPPQAPPPVPPPASSGEVREIEDSIDAIAQHFDPESFLSMISKFVESNPKQAQMLFQQFQMQQQADDND